MGAAWAMLEQSQVLAVLSLGILGLLTGYLWVEILSRKIILPVSEMRPADHVHEHAFKFEHPRKILVLNSYHSGYSWSDNEMNGIVETLQHVAPSIEPVIEFLDCKRFPGMEQFPRLVELFKSKYSEGQERACRGTAGRTRGPGCRP